MGFRIKHYDDWDIPYNTPNGELSCRNIGYDEYHSDSEYLAKQIIKDILDPPEAEMTLEMIEKEFSEPSGKWYVPEENLIAIQTYYNGRYALYQQILKDLEINKNYKKNFKYQIPYEYNHFNIDDEKNVFERQRNSYIEIEIF